jgi:hypothetical protein
VQRREAPIVGPDVPDQRTLRPPERVLNLDEFLDFLARLEDVFGHVERRPRRTTGDRFLL